MLNISDLYPIKKEFLEKPVEKAKEINKTIQAGGRNDHLFKKGCSLIKKGLSQNEVLALLELENKKCAPPLDSDEVFQIAISCTKYKEEKKEIKILNIKEFYNADLFPPPVPIVVGLINRGEFHICTATAKTGKTLLQLNLAKCVSRGEKFLDYFETKKLKVLIIQTEVSNANLRNRVVTIFGNEKQPDAEDVLFTNSRIKLDKIEGLNTLSSLIDEHKPDLLILDPFYTLHTGNEDSSSEMAPLLSDIREIAIQKNIGILLIHHQGKKRERGSQTGHKARGSSSFADAPDGSWSLQKSSTGDYLTLHFEMRNIESPGPFQLKQNKENLTFKIVGALEQIDDNLNFGDIKNFILQNPNLYSSDIQKELSQIFGVSIKTVQRRLKEAVLHEEITKRREGRNIIYSIKGETNEKTKF